MGITACDFDNDGDLDLATKNYITGGIHVIFNDGNGSFNLDLIDLNYFKNDMHILFDYSGDFDKGKESRNIGSDGSKRIVTGDYDKDGDYDIAITITESDIARIFFNNGNGKFGDHLDFSVGDNPYEIVTDDFDNDGDLDLATANSDDYDITVLIGDGHGGFGERVDYRVGYWPTGIIADYFNVDTPIPQVASNHSQTSYDPGTLEPLTTYYWKIVARDNHGATTHGPIWSFTTEDNPIELNIKDSAENFIDDFRGQSLQSQ
jgi:hypothetical protein